MAAHAVDALPDLFSGGDRAEPAHGLRRPGLSRHRWLHGRRRLCGLQYRDLASLAQHHRRPCVGRIGGSGGRILFGLPSLRIKGFYLAVATLAAQFFLSWAFIRVPWITHYSASGIVTFPAIVLFGVPITTSAGRYLFTLCIVTVLALVAKNLVRANAGRTWMAIRDMDIAAEIIGIRPLRTKLLAFAVSSFYCGIAGALLAYVFLGSVEPAAFDLDRSFQILFMIIIGGLGSILGCFLGAAFITLLPIFLNRTPTALGLPLSTATISHIEFMTFGALIIFFLIVEPHGLARLWQIAKEKLRLWPFPH